MIPPFLKHWFIQRRLKATMKPCPEYRKRRLAQFSPERKQRYFANVAKVYLGREAA